MRYEGDYEDDDEDRVYRRPREDIGNRKRKLYRIAEYLASLPKDQVDAILPNLVERVNVAELSPMFSVVGRLFQGIADDMEERDPFFRSQEWKELRYRALKKFKGRCCCCGADRYSGAVLQADHIKPRSKHPELALDINNIQVLCRTCNEGKSNKDETDWRQNAPIRKR